MRFSQRVGASAVPKVIQIESMDLDLRNSLWNEMFMQFNPASGLWAKAAAALGQYLYKVRIDQIPELDGLALEWISRRFFDSPWHEVYDTVEFLVANVDSICRPEPAYRSFYRLQQAALLARVNGVLERELSGYRFINGVLAPISDPAEILAIEQASQVVAKTGLHGAHEHIATALSLLGKKPQPDYRNSIKESISAVESVVKAVTQNDGNGVAEAVDQLATKTEIHGALKAAIKQLYGYSSDSEGIRHAILDQPNVGYDEAKFMLVACAAFVNFLVSKASDAGLLHS